MTSGDRREGKVLETDRSSRRMGGRPRERIKGGWMDRRRGHGDEYGGEGEMDRLTAEG